MSTRDEIEIIKKAKAIGIKVTCEISPHHLFLSTEDAKKLGQRSAVCPALASEEDRKALWDNLDVIDVFATDHAPHTIQEKDSSQPPPGFPGLETCLPLFLTAIHNGLLTLQQLVDRMYYNPKEIFKIPDQNDTYVEIDLDANWTIPESLPFSKCGWTPFAGRNVVGKVTKVVLRGEVAFIDGKVMVQPGFGQIIQTKLKRKPSMMTLEPLDSSLKVQTQEPVLVTATSSHAQKPLFEEEEVSSISPPVQLGMKTWLNKHILSITQFTRDDFHSLFSVASEMKMVVKRAGSMDICKGKILATLFYEPSTRTNGSFVAAMQRLGGTVFQVNEQFSSTQKGETLTDTVHCLGSYTDAIVIRHPQKGSIAQAAKVASKPIINAGDGTGEHPTQALLDVFTIREELGTVNGLTVTLVGDLKNGRTVHSLVRALTSYKVTLNYVSPVSLQMPQEVKDYVKEKKINQKECTKLEDVLSETDVLYVTRIQKERFESLEEYEKVKSVYCITPKTLHLCKERMAILHPLPRNTEISTEVDTDSRAAYFRQMENGMYVRMALLAMIFGKV